jgi:2-dehydro-3-deoxyphosphogluconate aldolase/(4S)-4-hydroxy-2-oxoglutarate aldolase
MSLAPATAAATTMARLSELGLVPVVELGEEAQAKPLLEALCAGGLPVAEITLRTPAGLGAIRALARAYPDAMVGAGTVRSTEDAARVLDAGARFVVCPGTDPELVAFCTRQDVLVMPGVCTPSEIQAALRAGARLLKFFPAEAMGGTAFLKALSGPFSEVRFVPTGGIDAANLASYLALAQVAACGGSWMVAKALVAAGDFSRVTELTAEAVAIVAATRSRHPWPPPVAATRSRHP